MGTYTAVPGLGDNDDLSDCAVEGFAALEREPSFLSPPIR